jgi:hypothetical protein
MEQENTQNMSMEDLVNATSYFGHLTAYAGTGIREF